MIDLIGVPFDLCGRLAGSRLGPDALRLAGLQDALKALGEEVQDIGDLKRRDPSPMDGGMKNAAPLAACAKDLKEAVTRSLGAGSLPIVLGGDHAMVIGGIGAALEKYPDLALLWIDAHADVNVPATSPSGNLHGMPVATLWHMPSGKSGLQNDEWDELTQIVGKKPLAKANTAWLGLRDLDPGEQRHVAEAEGCLPIAMDLIDRIGIAACIERIDAWMRERGSKHLWISFDVDSLDPVFAPGTGTTVRGGLTYREAHLTAELLNEELAAADCPYELVGVDLVETNPIRDTANMTAVVSVEWVCDLFGKRILGNR